MNTKHTPGPWKLIGSRALGFTVHGEHECGDTDALAICEGIKDRQCNEANARLMAAAPELLQALEYALGQLRGSKPLGPVHASSLKADIAIAEAAIAKAKGEKQ